MAELATHQLLLISQSQIGTVHQSTDPVHLKPKGEPGLATHRNDSSVIANPAATVTHNGTALAHQHSILDNGQHEFVVMRSLFTQVQHHGNHFLEYDKQLHIEGHHAVMHGVKTGTASVWSLLPSSARAAIENGQKVIAGVSAEGLARAGAAQAQTVMAQLASPESLFNLAITLGLLALSAVPGVGWVGTAVMGGDRLLTLAQNLGPRLVELTDLVAAWSEPMTPAQLAEATAQLEQWMASAGTAVLLSAMGRAGAKLAPKVSALGNSVKEVIVRKLGGGRKSHCACATGGPVIIATGEKTLSELDFELSHTVTIVWRRYYRSGLSRDGWFGQGWVLPMSVELLIGAQGLQYLDERARTVALPWLEVGQTHWDAYEQFTLQRPDAQTWVVNHKSGLAFHFVRRHAMQWRLPLRGMVNRDAQGFELFYRAVPQDLAAVHRPYQLRDTQGAVLHLSWTADDHLQEVSLQASPGDKPQLLVRYRYQDHQLVEAIDAAGHSRRYRWQNQVLTGYTTLEGGTFEASYDHYHPGGKVLRSWAQDGSLDDRFNYQPLLRRTTVTDVLGRATVYEYDAREDIIASTDAAGHRTLTPTDANGNPRSVQDALGRSTRYQHDARGNLVSLIDAAGHATRIDYNALDLPERLTDAAGGQWLRRYDERGHLIEQIDPLQQSTRYAYNQRGLPVQITDARGGRQTLHWDARAQLTQFIDCSGQSTEFRHDDRGRLVERRDSLGQSTRYVYDVLNRLTQAIDPDGGVHHYRYGAAGQLLGYTNPLGAQTHYAYNRRGQLLRRTDALGHTLHYLYDRASRLQALQNENGARHEFRYDLLNRVTDEIGFDGRHQRYVYNAAGELSHLIETGGSELGPGKVTHFERDALGRLTAKRHEEPDHEEPGHEEPGPAPPQHTDAPFASASSRFRYDPLGRLIGASNAAAQITLAYDPLGQLLSETQVLYGLQPQALQRRLSHRYDLLGNRVRTELPDGRALNRLYYGSGHLHQINLETPASEPGQPARFEVITDLERDALHREVQRSQGALSSHYEHDPLGRLTRHHASQGPHAARPVLERRYTYDAAGQLQQRQDSRRGGQHFEYDPIGRILAALPTATNTAFAPERFVFDPASNLLSPGSPDGALQTLPDNRLRTYQDLSFEYDPHGNLIRRTQAHPSLEQHSDTQLSWDAAHQLSRAQVSRHGVTQTTHYRYDALGRRISKTDAFGSTHYLWDGHLMLQSQRASQPSALFIHEPNSFVHQSSTHANQRSLSAPPSLIPCRNGFRLLPFPQRRSRHPQLPGPPQLLIDPGVDLLGNHAF